MKQMSGWMMTIVSGAVLAGLAGCKPSDAIKQGAVVGKGMSTASSPLDPRTVGTVAGTVRFVGKPPDRVRIDMSQDPPCTKGEENYAEQYVVHDGKLANVYLYVKSGPAVAMTAPLPTTPPVIMDQNGCKYVPHVVAIMKGGTVEFRNSDGTMHNIHTLPPGGEGRINVTQGAMGAPQAMVFKFGEVMMPVRCDLHPWMNAFVNVSETPFFAVTDSDGHFKIDGLPAGDYVLAAVHETLGEQTMPLTVKPHQTADANFSYAMK